MSAGGPNRSSLDRLFLEVRSAGAHRRQTLRSWAKKSTDVTTICKDQRWEIQKPIDLLARDIRSKNMTKKNERKPNELGPDSAGQSGDIQQIPNVADADSESVEELIEEGNAFEADAVYGVENAKDADVSEVTTRQVPEDDVPGDYRDGEDEPAA